MFEDSFDPEYNEEVKGLVDRYEEMLRKKTSIYFDLDEFETLIEHYVNERKFEEASEVVRHGSSIFPDSTMLMMREALLLANIGQRNRALSKLKNMLSFEPSNPDLHMALASVYSQNREHQSAIRHLREALKCAEEDFQFEIKRDLAHAYIEMEKPEEAVKLLKEILVIEPDNEAAIHELDYCYGRMGNTQEAISFFTSFLDDNPYSYSGWFSLGNAYLGEERPEEAANAYDFCLTILEDFTPAKFNLANALIQLGHYKEAGERLLEILEAEKEFPDPEIYCLIGECFEKRQEFLMSHDYYQKALEMEPDNTSALIGIAVIYQELELPEKALRYAEKAIKHDDSDPELKYIKADILKELERFDEALDIFNKMPESEKENPVYWLDLADLYLAMDQVVKALDLTEEALVALPGNPSLETRKAIYLIRSGHEKEGVNRLKVIFEFRPAMITEAMDYDEDLMTIAALRPYLKKQ